MNRRPISFVLALSLLGGAGILLAQGGRQAPPPTKPVKDPRGYGHAELEVGLGSFRLQRNSLASPEGRVDINFRGTVLVSDYTGKPIEISGNVRKEYEGLGRVVYFGKGRIVVDGKFTAFQWFGGDLKGTFDGNASVFMTGEYGGPSTGGGRLLIDDDPVRLWFSSGMTWQVPAWSRPGYGREGVQAPEGLEGLRRDNPK